MMRFTVNKFREISLGILDVFKGKEFIILLLLILLNIAFRLPITPHEIGVDAFGTHYVANSISINHRVEWSINPRDLLSLNPSIPVVILPLNLSIISQYTGLDIEKIILFFSIFLGIMGTLFSYLMAREILDDRFFRFLVVFCFSVSPIFLSVTSWTASTRGMFIAFLPLFIWCFLRFGNSNKKEYIVLAFFLFIMLIPVHGMFILSYTIWGAFIITEIYVRVRPRIRSITKFTHLSTVLFILFVSIVSSLFFLVNTFLEKLALNILLFLLIFSLWCVIYLLHKRYTHIIARIKPASNYLRLIVPIFLAFLFILLFLPQFFSGLALFERLKWSYHRGMFFTGWANYIIFLNMCVDYGSSEGILLPFALIGFFTILKNVDKHKNYFFLILILLPCTAFLIQGEYMNMFLSPILSILIAFGLLKIVCILKSRCSEKITIGFVTGLLIISLLFSNYMIQYWVFRINPISGNTYWMQEKTVFTALFLNDLGKNSTIVTNDGLLRARIHAITGISIDSRIYAKEIEADYILENMNIYGSYLSGSKPDVHPSEFLESVHRYKDKIYCNGFESILTYDDL